ncbi:cell division septation protein DedD [Actinoplanes lutulentus]|uniref:Cellulose binding domain-containing protein n=1 Tax=Actinoplanes lutulentus TaxID=1287878 RepID=A0A327ZG68_9ACTN|nr:cellulose binding domain-containing protein [Actinoplanes lutulentus]MBB2947967.1 cell division septation protein DedD [Actinoplanes lutulentus]RAK40152.1 cellulose binding domain-containing protein [Actinoplanes lutulentus]
MLAKRIVVPLSVLTVGAAAAVVGVLNADAAVATSCSVTYSVVNQWSSGFTGDVKIRNSGGTAIDGWTLGFTFPSGQKVASGWNGTWTQTGSAVTVKDAGWNKTLAAGAQVALGFNGTWSGSNTAPTGFTVNGVACGGAVATATASPTATATPTASKTATASPSASKTVAPTATSASPTPSKTPTATATATPTATVSKGVENCTDYAALVRGKYWVNNNVWGKADGTGSQCVWENGLSGDNLSWGTSWTWAGDNTKVKSYASAVLGWHWGWKATGTGLPVQLSAGKAVNASWNFQVTQTTSNVMNVAYDLWLHDMANPDWQNNPTDEVMVWLYKSGGAGPVGTKQATVTIAGTTWDLYKGNIGWEVYSFVRTSNTSSASLNLTDFTNDLAARGWLAKTKYLSSVQAGTEIFTGQGRLDTTAYSVKIG